jgi:dTDP-4-dehydrorhamnose reductase
MSDNNILILGANGMLGKMMSLYLKSNNELNVFVTARDKSSFIEKNFEKKFTNFQLSDNYSDNLKKIVDSNIDLIVNCIGVIKPKIDEKNPNSIKETILTNSYFPLELQNLALENQIKYIQIGTDCVFSGNDGSYTESSFMDAKDLYGKSKIVGEIEGINKSLIRSSIIGPEEGKGFSLMNWFLKNTQQEVSGYKNHLWNGVTTLNFAKVVEGFILSNEFNFKTQHLIPRNTITKANLLEEFKKHFNKDVVINHIDAEEIIDRTLLTINEQVNENLWKRAGYSSIPTVEENIEELANSEITHKIMKL